VLPAPRDKQLLACASKLAPNRFAARVAYGDTREAAREKCLCFSAPSAQRFGATKLTYVLMLRSRLKEKVSERNFFFKATSS